MMDVAYPVAYETVSEELRYSLRSLANLPHGAVWLSGHRPAWVTGVRHVPTPPTGRTKWERANDNLLALLDQPDLSDPFILMNDDFFVLEPFPDGPPMWHGGPALEFATKRLSSLACRNGMAATVALMRQWGLGGELYSYELHTPMVMHKARLAEVLRRALPAGIVPLYTRTLYGNVYAVGGERHGDVKVYRGTHHRSIAGWTLLSTDERSFALGTVGSALRSRFPDPSPYEMPGTAVPGRRRPVARPTTEESIMSDEILIAKRTGVVVINGKKRRVHRGVTTAHRDNPLAISHPHLWEPLRIDYPAPAVADADPAAQAQVASAAPASAADAPPATAAASDLDPAPAKPAKKATRAKAVPDDDTAAA